MNALDVRALLSAMEAAFTAFERQEPTADIIKAQTEARVLAKRVASQLQAMGRQP